MNKLFKILSFLAVIALFVTACGGQVAQAAGSAVNYQAVLGKSLDNKDVAEFIVSNNCSAANSFQLCNDAGMALWLDSNQVVKSVYLYPGGADGFAAYKGELPLGLAATDTMVTVEQKFGQPKVDHALQAGWEPGLPDQSFTTDYIHYWAIYKRFGVTIVYNSPSSDDKNATIYAILVNK